jgi:hypothetical protein
MSLIENYRISLCEMGFSCITLTGAAYVPRHFEKVVNLDRYWFGHLILCIIDCIPGLGLLALAIERITYGCLVPSYAGRGPNSEDTVESIKLSREGTLHAAYRQGDPAYGKGPFAPLQGERISGAFIPEDWEELLRLNKQFEELYQEARTEEGQKNLKEISERCDALLLKKVALINKQNLPKSDKILALTFFGRIPKNTTLIHASSSRKNLDSILTEGIRKLTSNEQAEGRFGENELGQGLYVSQAGGYAGEGFSHAIALKTTEDIRTIRVPYKGNLLHKSIYKPLALNEDSITTAFTQIELGCKVIQRDGVPPRDEECVIRIPSGLKPTSFLQLQKNEIADKWVELKPIEGPLHPDWTSP